MLEVNFERKIKNFVHSNTNTHTQSQNTCLKKITSMHLKSIIGVGDLQVLPVSNILGLGKGYFALFLHFLSS